VIPRSIDLPDRVTLEYVEQGDPTGPPLFLLHGVTDSWHSFEPVLPYLPPAIRAFALSQRGHGDSDHPEVGYTLRDMAEDVVAFMDAVGFETAVVAGHSMGSCVGQRLAIDHPERIRGLVLAGTFDDMRRNPVVRELWDDVISGMTDPVDPGFIREFQESTLARPVPPEFMVTVLRESGKLPARVWKAVWEGFLTDDVADGLPRIRIPTRVLWGDRDTICIREGQERVRAAIPHAGFVAYEGAGHALHWEEPERFAADLAAFVEELEG
jgi:pimeloyl-ACP methyl ester carboxylesterase